MSHHLSIIEIYRHHHHDLIISILVILLFVFFVLDFDPPGRSYGERNIPPPEGASQHSSRCGSISGICMVRKAYRRDIGVGGPAV